MTACCESSTVTVSVSGDSWTDGLRQAEVENLDASVVGDEHVGRLDVSMDHSAFVGGGHAIGNLERVVDGLSHRQRPALDPLVQRFAFEDLSDDICELALDADVVDRDDVGMIQAAGRPRLLLESTPSIGILREGVGQYLDGDVATELGIARTVDLSHATRAQGTEDFEAPDAVAHRERHGE